MILQKLAKIAALFFCLPGFVFSQRALVLQSDFGTKDAAVASMKGVAFGVSPKLPIFDLTHEIPAFDIWQAAYRLQQAAPYWPAGTVFVSVVDPGVGTARKSVVLKTKSGHFFVSPDNGTLTLVAGKLGIAAVRQIDENRNRRAGSWPSHTFHGRDVYAFTGAKLAAGLIDFSQVGPLLPPEIVAFAYQKRALVAGEIRGTIPILDVQFGNVWTNIDSTFLRNAGVQRGNLFAIQILNKNKKICELTAPLVATFGDVPARAPLLYINSVGELALALNLGNFAEKYNVQSGPDWRIHLRKTE